MNSSDTGEVKKVARRCLEPGVCGGTRVSKLPNTLGQARVPSRNWSPPAPITGRSGQFTCSRRFQQRYVKHSDVHLQKLRNDAPAQGETQGKNGAGAEGAPAPQAPAARETRKEGATGAQGNAGGKRKGKHKENNKGGRQGRNGKGGTARVKRQGNAARVNLLGEHGKGKTARGERQGETSKGNTTSTSNPARSAGQKWGQDRVGRGMERGRQTRPPWWTAQQAPPRRTWGNDIKKNKCGKKPCQIHKFPSVPRVYFARKERFRLGRSCRPSSFVASMMLFVHCPAICLLRVLVVPAAPYFHLIYLLAAPAAPQSFISQNPLHFSVAAPQRGRAVGPPDPPQSGWPARPAQPGWVHHKTPSAAPNHGQHPPTICFPLPQIHLPERGPLPLLPQPPPFRAPDGVDALHGGEGVCVLPRRVEPLRGPAAVGPRCPGGAPGARALRAALFPQNSETAVPQPPIFSPLEGAVNSCGTCGVCAGNGGKMRGAGKVRG
eukprot:gene12754-biopygen6469